MTITVSPSPHDYGSDHPPNAAPPSPPPAPPVLARPALISGPDNSASHQSSDYGWDLTRSGNNVTGWATLAGRGTPETSCLFAGNVLTSYWNQCGLAIKLRGPIRRVALWRICRPVVHLYPYLNRLSGAKPDVGTDPHPRVQPGMDEIERQAIREEGYHPDDPAVVAALDLFDGNCRS